MVLHRICPVLRDFTLEGGKELVDLLVSYFVHLNCESLDLRNSKDPCNLNTPCVVSAWQWSHHPLFHWAAAYFHLGQNRKGGGLCVQGSCEICLPPALALRIPQCCLFCWCFLCLLFDCRPPLLGGYVDFLLPCL